MRAITTADYNYVSISYYIIINIIQFKYFIHPLQELIVFIQYHFLSKSSNFIAFTAFCNSFQSLIIPFFLSPATPLMFTELRMSFTMIIIISKLNYYSRSVDKTCGVGTPVPTCKAFFVLVKFVWTVFFCGHCKSLLGFFFYNLSPISISCFNLVTFIN